jgi:hypothetical protein
VVRTPGVEHGKLVFCSTWTLSHILWWWSRFSILPHVLAWKVNARIWAIRCKECGGWFYLCRQCFHGQCYCSDSCRQTARRRQCKEAQARYLAKRAGKQRRAAAAASYRSRLKLGGGANRSGPKRNRSRYLAEPNFVRKALSDEACCAVCGVKGIVKVWT